MANFSFLPTAKNPYRKSQMKYPSSATNRPTWEYIRVQPLRRSTKINACLRRRSFILVFLNFTEHLREG